MNIDDINAKINRLYISIDRIIDNDFQKHINRKFEGDSVTVDFEGNKNEIGERIFNIIHNLATFKDHLKSRLKNKKLDEKIIENEINNSFYLQILIDLDNMDKHTTDLKKFKYGQRTEIRNETQRILDPEDLNKLTIMTMGTEGEINLLNGNLNLIINAEIFDNNNNYLFSFNELIDESLNNWHTIIDKYNLTT